MLSRFCFWFSVRLGSIVVGISYMVQWSIWLMLSIISLENKTDVINAMKECINTLSIKNRHILNLANDPSILSITGTVYFSICILSAILVIYGAFKFQARLLLSFLIVNAIYIIFILILHIILMLHFKRMEYSLGHLILYSNIGAVILMFFIYKWLCVYSLFVAIKDVKKELGRQILDRKERRREMKSMMDTKYFYNVK